MTQDQGSDGAPLDGNAAAGLLGSVLPYDLSRAELTCLSCGAASVVATLRAYLSDMGTVLYCPHCGQLNLRLSVVGGRAWLDLSGARVLALPIPG